MSRGTVGFDRCYCLAEVDIFTDLAPAEMDTLAAGARMRTYAAGELLYAPQSLVEALFILKRGRVRVFRVTTDGRAFTTGIINPGTIFGEIVLTGQPIYDSYAEALDETVVCVMSRDHVLHQLLADPRIADTLGRRLAQMEVHVALTHDQLAALAGTRRATAAKVLGELANRGLIHLARGEVIILDVAGVAAEAGD